MCVLTACILHVYLVPLEIQRGNLVPLELELWIAGVNCYVDAARGPCKSNKCP